MKKLYSALLLLILVSLSVHAKKYEPFISQSRVWRWVWESEGTSSVTYNVEIGYFGDTITFNHTIFHLFYMKNIQPTASDTYVDYYFREDTAAKAVWIYDLLFQDSAMIYNFALNKGDNFSINLGALSFSQTVTKTDTFTTPAGGKLKRIVFADSTTWIESLGCVTQTTLPSTGRLICVKENDVVYKNESFADCDTVFAQPATAIQDDQMQKQVVLYPNPVKASSVLKINGADGVFKVEIFTLSGVMVVSDFFSGTYSLGSVPLSAGMYLYRVTDGSKIICVDKFIVE
jgi:hypothetical protein